MYIEGCIFGNYTEEQIELIKKAAVKYIRGVKPEDITERDVYKIFTHHFIPQMVSKYKPPVDEIFHKRAIKVQSKIEMESDE